MIKILAGIQSMSEDEYHSDPCAVPSLSASLAKILIAQTPLHCWSAHPKLNPNFVREERDLFDKGTIAHALLLQGIEAGGVLDYPDWRKGDARAARDAARAAGQIPILTKHWAAVKTMVDRAHEQLAVHREAKDAFTKGKPEQVLTWTDQASDGTEVLCRARLDWLDDDFRRVLDYKSTGTSVNPEAISRYAINQGWDVQAAFYRRGLLKLTGIDPQFLFIAQEDYAPYALAVFGMGPDFAWSGEQKTQAAIDKWAACLKTDQWPAYPDRICFPVLPAWAEEAWIRKEAES